MRTKTHITTLQIRCTAELKQAILKRSKQLKVKPSECIRDILENAMKTN